MEQEADFYLTTAGESQTLAAPRACYVKGRLRNQAHDECMLIRIDPPLSGQGFGLGDKEIFDLIISPRFEGSSFFPISEWPSHVYVARISNEEIVRTLVILNDRVELIAWGTIFRTHEEANAQAGKF